MKVLERSLLKCHTYNTMRPFGQGHGKKKKRYCEQEIEKKKSRPSFKLKQGTNL